jgi:hypothetical protein
MHRILLTAAAVLALAGSAQAGPNLVKNGSLELSNLTPTSFDAFKGAHPGFNVVGVEIDANFGFFDAVTAWDSPLVSGSEYNLYFFNGATATSGDAATRYAGEEQRPNSNFSGASPDGGGFMVLDGDPGFSGRFGQVIDGLTVGNKYQLSFYWAGGELSNRTGYESIALTGNFGLSAFSTPVFNNTKPVGVAGDFSGWSLQTFSFKATSTSQLLSFLAVGTPAANLPPVAFLDGVSLVEVPEPSTWALMLMGFGGLGVMIRTRRRLAA